MRSSKRLLALAITLFGLTSCGYGPIYTCRTPCKLPEVRNVFCDCYVPKPPSPGGNTNNPSPPYYGSPHLNFTWADSPSCGSINRAYYVFNPTPNDLELWVSRKQRSGARVGSWVYASKQTASFDTAAYIGLEGLEPDCYDQDFQSGTWRDAKTKVDGYLAHIAAANGVSVETLLSGNSVRDFERKDKVLDCKNLCNASQSKEDCMRLNPTDVTAADNARANVLNGVNSGNIDWNEALAPIIGNNPECRRSETALIKDRMAVSSSKCNG